MQHSVKFPGGRDREIDSVSGAGFRVNLAICAQSNMGSLVFPITRPGGTIAILLIQIIDRAREGELIPQANFSIFWNFVPGYVGTSCGRKGIYLRPLGLHTFL